MTVWPQVKQQTKKKWANPGLFLFIFVLFKHNTIEKTLGFSGIRTRIVGVEGEHADHLTTTTAPAQDMLAPNYSAIQLRLLG